MRKKIVAGNWKMNKTLEEAQILASELMGMVTDEVKSNVDVILCTPFPYLMAIKKLLGSTPRMAVGAQNCSDQEWGAFTGEVSATMLLSIGIPFVIVGHSERRLYFGEDGKLLAKKVDTALRCGLLLRRATGDTREGDPRNPGKTTSRREPVPPQCNGGEKSRNCL